MWVDVRVIVAALEAAISDQRANVAEDDSCYEMGYLDGLERAANIVVIKAHGLKAGVET
jgi:hypothetical protein